MKLETFFEKFEQFADAPNAVAKMRELVLELAIQGKLIEQDANDVSAITSLRKCTRAVRELEVNDDDTVPSGWVSVPLGCVIASNIGGGTPSKQNSAYWNGSIPWASVKDIQTDKYLSATIDSITEEGLKHSSSNLIPANRLIVVTRMGLGKLAINKIPTAINQDLRAIEPNESLNLDFAYLLFKALKMVGKGVTVKGIRIDVLHSMPVALPPLAEQKRIVAKVDELMALCDRLEAQQQERDIRHATLARASLARFAEAPTPSNLDFLFHQSYTISPADLRKSILTLAVQGQLIGASDDSSGWPAVRMRDVCLQITDGEHATPQRTSSGVPLATAKNVRDGFLDLTSTDWVAPTTAEKCWKRCKPRHDDLLMVCVGATTGRVCLVQNPPDIVLVRSVALIRPNPERIASTYLNLFLRSPAGQSQIWGNVKQSAQPCLYLGKMSEFEIMLPPLAEQRRIVAKVDQLMALVDQLETQLATSRATAERLVEAAVAELTAQ